MALLLGAFAGGIAWAGKLHKTGIEQFFLGIVLGFAILCIIAGVGFAGCSAYLLVALSHH